VLNIYIFKNIVPRVLLVLDRRDTLEAALQALLIYRADRGGTVPPAHAHHLLSSFQHQRLLIIALLLFSSAAHLRGYSLLSSPLLDQSLFRLMADLLLELLTPDVLCSCQHHAIYSTLLLCSLGPLISVQDWRWVI